MTNYLTRAVIDKNAPEHSLRPLLDPKDRNIAPDVHRRLIWTLFPDKQASRDFIWRADGKGKFMIVSARKPQPSRLFWPIQTKLYDPKLIEGDRLAFVLRVNATKDRRSQSKDTVMNGTKRRPIRDRRVDIVMHEMHQRGIKADSNERNSRANLRMEIAADAARSWFAGQGTRRGFDVKALVIEDYRVSALKRRGGGIATLGILDLKGILSVTDPKMFTKMLFTGLGRARAFGCGLMLVRRV